MINLRSLLIAMGVMGGLATVSQAEMDDIQRVHYAGSSTAGDQTTQLIILSGVFKNPNSEFSVMCEDLSLSPDYSPAGYKSVEELSPKTPRPETNQITIALKRKAGLKETQCNVAEYMRLGTRPNDPVVQLSNTLFFPLPATTERSLPSRSRGARVTAERGSPVDRDAPVAERSILQRSVR